MPTTEPEQVFHVGSLKVTFSREPCPCCSAIRNRLVFGPDIDDERHPNPCRFDVLLDDQQIHELAAFIITGWRS
jgi:hypothetical protein